MASNSPAESAGAKVIEAFQFIMECSICTNFKELRLLPCQHMMCDQCLVTILANPNKRCPFCLETLTGNSAQAYPVCRLASEIQQVIQQLANALEDYHLTDDEEKCQNKECTRHMDVFCTSCLLFICYKCGKKTKCLNSETPHTSEDYDQNFFQKVERKYANWKTHKEQEIRNLETKRGALMADIQRKTLNLSADNLEEVQSETVRLQKTEYQNVCKKLAEEREMLSQYSKHIGEVVGKQFVKLVFCFCGDSQDTDTSLDTECSVVMSQICYDVTDWEGKMLVGRNGGFDLVDSRVSPDTSERGSQSRSHRVLESVSTAVSGHINSIQYYNNHIYTLCADKSLGSKRQVIVFDTKYKEVRRWSVPDYWLISQLAVCSNKVYVSDPDNKQLCVYSATSGKLLPPVSNPLFVRPANLNISPPHSVLISDRLANKVHRLDCRYDTIAWTSPVVKDPRGIALDQTRGEVWLYSKAIKSLFILNSDTGEFKQEIHHEKLTQLPVRDNLIGMCLVDGVLWGAAESSGLLKFAIK